MYGQGVGAIAIGNGAANSNQGNQAIAIANSAGDVNQGVQAIAIGQYAGQTNQGSNSIAIGSFAGQTNQGANSIVLNASGSAVHGTTANAFYVAPVRNTNTTNLLYYNTGNKEISYDTIGGSKPLKFTGDIVILNDNNSLIDPAKTNIDIRPWFQTATGKQSYTVSLGFGAGFIDQQNNAISIGYYTGNRNQGQHSIAIGSYAGSNNQPSRSIVINASGSLLDGINSDSCYIAPIRGTAGAAYLYYDAATKEVQVLSSDSNIKMDITTARNYLDDLCRLRPVTFKYISSFGHSSDPDKKFLGLIAQEVQDIFPSLVYKNDKNLLSFVESGFPYMLITAVQSLNSTNQGLQSTIQLQHEQINLQQERLSFQEEQISKIMAKLNLM